MTEIEKSVVKGALLLLFFSFALKASGSCERPELLNEHKDVATLQRLETAWSIAYLKGDTEFERCLLTPDFTEIMGSGEVAALKDELGFAEANQGKNLPIPDFPKSTILIHGNAAVAYGTSSSKEHVSEYADYYVWERGAWHAYFAQQTRIQENLTGNAADFLDLKVTVGGKLWDVFSKTPSYESEGLRVLQIMQRARIRSRFSTRMRRYHFIASLQKRKPPPTGSEWRLPLESPELSSRQVRVGYGDNHDDKNADPRERSECKLRYVCA